jgi:hypothetical protein
MQGCLPGEPDAAGMSPVPRKFVLNRAKIAHIADAIKDWVNDDMMATEPMEHEQYGG